MAKNHYIAFDRDGAPWGVLEFDFELPTEGKVVAFDEDGVPWGFIDGATGQVTPFEELAGR